MLPGDVDVLLTHVPPTFGEDQLVEPTYGGVSLTSGQGLLGTGLSLLFKSLPLLFQFGPALATNCAGFAGESGSELA